MGTSSYNYEDVIWWHQDDFTTASTNVLSLTFGDGDAIIFGKAPSWDNISDHRKTSARETIAIIDEEGDYWEKRRDPDLCPYCGMKESKCGCGWC